jgi:hypothetical protein
MQMDVKGLLVGIRRYSFPDRESGEIIEGGKLTLVQSGDSTKDSAGLVVVELPIAYHDFPALKDQGASLWGKDVVVDCDLVLTGKRPKMRALSIRAPLMKAAA